MEPLLFKADQIIYCEDNDLWFSDYMPEIPSNVLIHKTIPGFGATTGEINAQRHSIIVLPNVASILNKYDSHMTDSFTVYEGVKISDIIQYMLQNTEKHKKILSTPESLRLIKRACERIRIDFNKYFFILFDESHKYIKDVDWRPRITEGFDFFFEFDHKAMISSTPIVPSDPRFSNFKKIKFQPLYDYSMPVDLFETNSIPFGLKYTFKKHPEVKQFVFFNSINGIVDLINKLGIGKDAIVFCSKESAEKVGKLDYAPGCNIRSAAKFDAALTQQYNFFTSSLFNGLDIVLEEAPQVTLVTVANDPKTFLDPYTDVVQILGRFRKHKNNPQGIYKSAIHILSFPGRVCKSKEQTTSWLLSNQKVYDEILSLLYSRTNEVEKDVFRESLRRLPFHNYVGNEEHLYRNTNLPILSNDDPDCIKYKLDYFKIDSLFETERVNSYYANGKYLWAAYKQTGYAIYEGQTFKSFKVYGKAIYARTDQYVPLNMRGNSRLSPEIIKNYIKQLQEFQAYCDKDQYEYQATKVTIDFPFLKKAFEILGAETIASLNYRKSKIEQAIIDYEYNEGINSNALIDSIYLKFSVNYKIPVTKIKKDLQELFDHFQIKATVTASDIMNWFEVEKTRIVSFSKDKSNEPNTTIEVRKEVRAYKLIRRKFNLNESLQRT